MSEEKSGLIPTQYGTFGEAASENKKLSVKYRWFAGAFASIAILTTLYAYFGKKIIISGVNFAPIIAGESVTNLLATVGITLFAITVALHAIHSYLYGTAFHKKWQNIHTGWKIAVGFFVTTSTLLIIASTYLPNWKYFQDFFAKDIVANLSNQNFFIILGAGTIFLVSVAHLIQIKLQVVGTEESASVDNEDIPPCDDVVDRQKEEMERKKRKELDESKIYMEKCMAEQAARAAGTSSSLSPSKRMATPTTSQDSNNSHQVNPAELAATLASLKKRDHQEASAPKKPEQTPQPELQSSAPIPVPTKGGTYKALGRSLPRQLEENERIAQVTPDDALNPSSSYEERPLLGSFNPSDSIVTTATPGVRYFAQAPASLSSSISAVASSSSLQQ